MARLAFLKGHIVRNVRDVSGSESLGQHDMFAVPIEQASFSLTVPHRELELVVVGGKKKFEETRRVRLLERVVVNSLTYLRVYAGIESEWAVVAGIDVKPKSYPEGYIELGGDPQPRRPRISPELNPFNMNNDLGLSDEELERTLRAQDRLNQVGPLSAGRIARDIDLSFGYGGLNIGPNNLVVRNMSDDKDFRFNVTPINPADLQQEYGITTPEHES